MDAGAQAAVQVMIEEATNKMRQDIDRLQKDFDDMDIEAKGQSTRSRTQ